MKDLAKKKKNSEMKEEKLMLPVSFVNWFKVRRLN